MMKRAEPLTRERIETACRLCRTTRQAADRLGCSPSSFLRRVKQLGIAWDGLKPKKAPERRNGVGRYGDERAAHHLLG